MPGRLVTMGIHVEDLHVQVGTSTNIYMSKAMLSRGSLAEMDAEWINGVCMGR